MMAKIGVIIGRFQPFHQGHGYLVQCAIEAKMDKILFLCGSSNRARCVKNPWYFQERCQIISDFMQHNHSDFAFECAGLFDYYYNEDLWIKQARGKVAQNTTPEDSIHLIAHDKDDSSYYLYLFPDWKLELFKHFKALDATQIRQDYFAAKPWHNHLDQTTVTFLEQFKSHKAYARLAQEQQFLRDYKQSWSSSPYPPLFVTADALVCCQDHILLIKRGNHPGLGLYALPGGFVEAGELIQTSILRELQEETTIGLEKNELLAALQSIKVYDYPSRSQIGRVITHVGLFQLPNRDLVAVKGSDDAQEALWYPCDQMAKIAHKMHDDHFLIIQDQLSWYQK